MSNHQYEVQTEARAERGEDAAETCNESLDDMIHLLEREIERLKVSLDNHRLSKHPERESLVRWHVRAIDDRQDALDRLKEMVVAERDEGAVH